MAIQIHEAQGEDTQTEVRAQASRERDETQQHLDSRFGNVLKRWTEAKRPVPGPGGYNGPSDRVTVASKDVAAVKSMIRRAGTLHKHGVTFFKDRKDANGAVTVKYVPKALPPKADASK